MKRARVRPPHGQKLRTGISLGFPSGLPRVSLGSTLEKTRAPLPQITGCRHFGRLPQTGLVQLAAMERPSKPQRWCTVIWYHLETPPLSARSMQKTSVPHPRGLPALSAAPEVPRFVRVHSLAWDLPTREREREREGRPDRCWRGVGPTSLERLSRLRPAYRWPGLPLATYART